jgi:recombination protein RecT
MAQSRLPAHTTPDEPQGISGQIESLVQSGALQRALPTGISDQRFARIVLTELRKTPKLARTQPATFLGAVMTAAQLGLEFGPLGHAYLVPYGQDCQLIVGYKGYIDLARRSGQLKSIVARPVHENDVFEYQYGTEEFLRHVPAKGDRGQVTDYYGVAILHDGGQVIHVMSPSDVEAFRKRSKAGGSGPWQTDYDAMACKTVIRRMTPWLPMSTEAAQAVESDERVIRWDGVAPTIVADDEPVEATIVDVDPLPTPEGTEPA